MAGLRCTDAARTLVDLAAEAGPTEVAGAVDRALARRLVTLAGLERSLPPRRRGVGRLRRCLAERGYLGAPAPSVLESRMMRILLELDLPLPRAEVRAGPDGSYRIDFAYPAVRLAIECYGYAWHSSPQQMAHDLYRQRQLSLEGWTVLIYTWTDVVEHPMKVGREIAAVYSRLAAPAPPTAAGRVVAR